MAEQQTQIKCDPDQAQLPPHAPQASTSSSVPPLMQQTQHQQQQRMMMQSHSQILSQSCTAEAGTSTEGMHLDSVIRQADVRIVLDGVSYPTFYLNGQLVSFVP